MSGKDAEEKMAEDIRVLRYALETIRDQAFSRLRGAGPVDWSAYFSMMRFATNALNQTIPEHIEEDKRYRPADDGGPSWEP